MHIYSISRAGYIPHSFGRIAGAAVVKELPEQSDTKALIYSKAYKEIVQGIDSVRLYEAATSIPESNTTLPRLHEVGENEIALIVHTSGSTSGKPKLVHGSYKWLDGVIKKMGGSSYPQDGNSPEVFN
ncbi:hypothetical protein V5O48_014165 [Marasmius crinis-equi]|uniref:AMP-dependent synthetase/ligase domain-containing protein n=1 Tax=Marasmius crinis-equi TaxID=585013 RepID=A0ABR3EY21_9AGAR